MADPHDPFRSPESVLRPRPGAGRRPGGPASPPFAPSAPGPLAVPAAVRDLGGLGLSPLVRAAAPVILLAGHLRDTRSVSSVTLVQRQAREEIRLFEERARAAGISSEITLVARYALCAALDEAALSTPWGSESEWTQHSLLVALHKEAWGGEKFFDMLERTTQDPNRFMELIEVQYLCLALGFGGKFVVKERGHQELADVQRRVYRMIRDARGASPADLSLKWRGEEDRRNPLIRYVPWWVVAAAALAILVVAFGLFLSRLRSAQEPVKRDIAAIGTAILPSPSGVVPKETVTLGKRLEAEERDGQLRIAETGDTTVVTLDGAALFASGSADLTPAARTVLARVAAELNSLEGRVWVFGHTDNQPPRSVRYDNYDLSTARARSVATVLEQGAPSKGRIPVQGRGADDPLPGSEADPARNRRVEIKFIAGSW